MDTNTGDTAAASDLDQLLDEFEAQTSRLISARQDYGRVLGSFDEVLARAAAALDRGQLPLREHKEAERLAAQLSNMEAALVAHFATLQMQLLRSQLASNDDGDRG